MTVDILEKIELETESNTSADRPLSRQEVLRKLAADTEATHKAICQYHLANTPKLEIESLVRRVFGAIFRFSPSIRDAQPDIEIDTPGLDSTVIQVNPRRTHIEQLDDQHPLSGVTHDIHHTVGIEGYEEPLVAYLSQTMVGQNTGPAIPEAETPEGVAAEIQAESKARKAAETMGKDLAEVYRSFHRVEHARIALKVKGQIVAQVVNEARAKIAAEAADMAKDVDQAEDAAIKTPAEAERQT